MHGCILQDRLTDEGGCESHIRGVYEDNETASGNES
jgi:hypothetical protein